MRKIRKSDDITILNTYQFENENQPLFSNNVLEAAGPIYSPYSPYDEYFFHSKLILYHTSDIINGGYDIFDGDKSYALSKIRGSKIYITTALYSKCKYAYKKLGIRLDQIV